MHANTYYKNNEMLLPHITNKTYVRNMESIFIFLGAHKMNFYGFSYSIIIGQWYTDFFLDIVNCFILDLVFVNKHSNYNLNLNQNYEFDVVFNIFFHS